MTEKCNIDTCWAEWEKWCLDAAEWDISYYFEWCDIELDSPRKLKTLFDYQ